MDRHGDQLEAENPSWGYHCRCGHCSPVKLASFYSHCGALTVNDQTPIKTWAEAIGKERRKALDTPGDDGGENTQGSGRTAVLIFGFKSYDQWGRCYYLVANLCLTHSTSWTIARQAPLSMEFSTQECWSGLPFSSSGYLPNPGIEPRSPALQADSSPSKPPGKPDERDSLIYITHSLKNRWTHAIINLFCCQDKYLNPCF